MDPQNNVQQNEISSNNVAHNIFQGSSFNTQEGNIYVSDYGTRREPEKSLYDVLAYEGMNARAEQLSLPTIPKESFDWVWRTKFKAWLSDSDPFFWICGKPGSGKSTLVHYLVRTKQTQDLLERSGTNWTIVDFFFDYRAGKTAANNVQGILRKFLLQLCDKFPNVQAKLETTHRNRVTEADNLPSLIDTFCETIRSLQLRVCLFVDGLDEFEGDFDVLVETLIGVQDRTGTKICLASRPEPTFTREFDKFPSFKMQDYNMASIRVYINRAINKGRDELSNVDSIFDIKLREEILARAQGVIVWAKLAIDELLIAARSKMSQIQIQALLERLPPDLEQMYDRCLSRIRPEHAAEASTILYILNEFGGELENAFFSQLWDFVRAQPTDGRGLKAYSDEVVFIERVSRLLGVFIDVLEKRKSVRVMHKTLLSYLSTSARLRSMLPSEFEERFTPFTEFRICSAVVVDATQYLVNDSHVIERWRQLRTKLDSASPLTPILRSFKGGNWESEELLLQSIRRLPNAIRSIACRSQEEMEMIHKALSSLLMLFSIGTFGETFELEYQCLVLPDIRQYGVVDLWFAISHGLSHYVRQRLKTVQQKKAHIWEDLFEHSITCMIKNPNSRSYAFPSARRIAWLIRYHWEHFGMKSTPLAGWITTWLGAVAEASYSSASCSDELLHICEIVLSVKPSEMSAIHGIRKDSYCSCGADHTLHSWADWAFRYDVWATRNRQSRPSQLLSGILLSYLFKTNISVNALCANDGTAMHQCLAASRVFWDDSYCHPEEEHLLSAHIAILAKLGVNPDTKFKNQTLLSQAKALRRMATLKTIVTIGCKGVFQSRPLTRLIELLEYHKQHGQWPDFTELEVRRPELKHYHFDESGQFLLEDTLIDVFAQHTEGKTQYLDGRKVTHATPEQKARWVSILSRHKNGTLYADIEQQCKKWLESDDEDGLDEDF